MAHHNKSHERSGDIRVRLPIIQDKNLNNLSRRNSAAHGPAMLLAAKRSALAAVAAASKVGYGPNGSDNDKSAEKPTSVAALLRKRGGDNASSAAPSAGIVKTRRRARKASSANVIDSPRKHKVGEYPAALAAATAMAASAASHATTVRSAPVPAASPRGVGVKPEDVMYFSPATTALAMNTQNHGGHGLPLQNTTSPAPFMLPTHPIPEFPLPALSTTLASQEASSNILGSLLPPHSCAAPLHESGSFDNYQLGQTYDLHSMWSSTDLDSAF